MTCVHITRLLTADPASAANPAHSKNFGERSRRLLNERAAAAASTDDTRMGVDENRPAEADPPPQPETFLDAEFYIKLKATIEVINVSGWDVFI